MRLRKPEVQRPEPDLGAETDERQDEAGSGESRRERERGEGGEIEAARACREQREEQEEKRRAEVRGCEVDGARARNLFPLVFECDQQERGDRHELPGEEEQHAVTRQHHDRHRRDQHVEGGRSDSEATRVLALGEVRRSVEGRQRRHGEDAE